MYIVGCCDQITVYQIGSISNTCSESWVSWTFSFHHRRSLMSSTSSQLCVHPNWSSQLLPPQRPPISRRVDTFFVVEILLDPRVVSSSSNCQKIWHLNNLLQQKPGHASYALDGRELSGTWRKKMELKNPLGMRKEKCFNRAKHLRNPMVTSPPPRNTGLKLNGYESWWSVSKACN